MLTRRNGLYKNGFYKKLQTVGRNICQKPEIAISSLRKKSISMIKNEINYQMLHQLTPRRKIYPLIKIKFKISKEDGLKLKESSVALQCAKE